MVILEYKKMLWHNNRRILSAGTAVHKVELEGPPARPYLKNKHAEIEDCVC